MSFVRKYWIAALVMLLVSIHAIIIGYVRSEATRLKTIASSEIPVGLFYKQWADPMWMTQLRVHLQVPPERRLAARATIEHNRWIVHEAVEEAIRGLDESLLRDPALVAVKQELKRAIDEVLHEKLVDKIVINDRLDLTIHELEYRAPQDAIAPGEESHAARSSTLTSVRPVRPTLTEQHTPEEHAEAGESASHDDPHGDAGHIIKSDPPGHAAKANAHGAAKASGHAPAKKAKSGH